MNSTPDDLEPNMMRRPGLIEQAISWLIWVLRR